ncbi:YonK family protein [Paenibacillus naphthalenovorans]|uniref:YonK protein n=1 Tax=Paenibacillus naphthalenovorans TaxID=162209 RepID=A0A0U2W462_9BACL|nr:YonK family protein [Paenibacillus naphthalenovorans]ALS22293.1 YonK protein [Paenibacillus naphthalenovorans]
MAKKNNSIAFKGLLEIETMEITEEDKNGIFVYDLLAALKEYDGKQVSLTIKEENPVQPKETEGEE